jgi:hypothetical protein
MATRTEDVNVRIGVTVDRRAQSAFQKIQGSFGALAAAYIGMNTASRAFDVVIKDSISSAAKFEATMTSLRSVVSATGRDMNLVYSEMQTQLGGLASRASVAEGYLKGMTTTLTVEQMTGLTESIKNASLAMGEDFNVQLPLIIKALKQLNPAILDNIGVTVRLDQVNQRIKNGYYGLATEINEATQQHAIYTEIIKQTAQFQGQEAAYLSTAAGQWAALKVQWQDIGETTGEFLLPLVEEALPILAGFTDAFVFAITNVGNVFVAGRNLIVDAATNIADVISNMIGTVSGGVRALYAAATLDFAGLRQAMFDTGIAAGKLEIATTRHFEDLEDNARNLAENIGRHFTTMFQRAVIGYGAVTAQLQAGVSGGIPSPLEMPQEDIDAAIDGVTRISGVTTQQLQVMGAGWRRLGQAMSQSMQNASSTINDLLWEGRTNATDVWKAMAKDFTHYFIDDILNQVAKRLVPGFLGLIGGIFSGGGTAIAGGLAGATAGGVSSIGGGGSSDSVGAALAMASRRGRNNLQTKDFALTGGPTYGF